MHLWVSANDGSIFEVSRSAGRGKWSHKRVYKHTSRVRSPFDFLIFSLIRDLQVNLLTYVPAFNLLALPCDDMRLVLVDVNTYKAIQSVPLEAKVR